MKLLPNINECPDCTGRLIEPGDIGVLRCVVCEAEFVTDPDDGGTVLSRSEAETKNEELGTKNAPAQP